jgi:hypothetical protein
MEKPTMKVNWHPLKINPLRAAVLIKTTKTGKVIDIDGYEKLKSQKFVTGAEF